jgi:hypothetical protein
MIEIKNMVNVRKEAVSVATTETTSESCTNNQNNIREKQDIKELKKKKPPHRALPT